MTPAEKLSKSKPWRREPRNKVQVRWKCRLREFREELRLSLRDVASAVGLSITGILAVEMGGETQLVTARKLCVFFGRHLQEIWPETAEGEGWK